MARSVQAAASVAGVATRDDVGPPPLPRLSWPWAIRTAAADGDDLTLVHDWMNRPHVAAAWKQAWSRDRWSRELAAQLAGDRSRPCVVEYEGSPLAYVEVYRVIRDRLARHYAAEPHDLGLHLAIGERNTSGRATGVDLARALTTGLFAADPACRRIMGEPDVTNRAIISTARRAGWRDLGDIVMPHKTARLIAFVRHDDDLPGPESIGPRPQEPMR